MSSEIPVPRNIQKASDSEMRIFWSTGEDTVVSFAQLRFQCRCAQCVDEWTRARRITMAEIRPDIRPTRVETVGRYAIQIDWNDGHKTGIYPYALLYDIAKGHADSASGRELRDSH